MVSHKVKKINNLITLICAFACVFSNVYAQSGTGRETLSLNSDWKFSLGHQFDVSKDYNFGTSHFSYLAKTGYGDGAAAEKFDDRAWRTVQIPHDWCVTLPFAANGSNSHGSKAIGKYYPENNIGWYRKYFTITEADTSKRIRVEFEGVFRNSQVFVNGFYVGAEESGYSGFSYDITEYLNFGGKNTIAVRVDATREEGWFYEGAGIYRNVWLIKTSKVHVTRYGTFVSSEFTNENATVTIRTTVDNENAVGQTFVVEQTVFNAKGEQVSTTRSGEQTVGDGDTKTVFQTCKISNPVLWSIENPHLYSVTTKILQKGVEVDTYTTTFGIRSVEFDKDKGFFLNGKSVKIKGVCVHQDHAGVGVAIPYDLQKWRIQQLQAIGVNAIRTSHNPPSPELLQICDELGVLVMDEVRLMGINEYHKKHVKELITRDRNHPSVIIWSLGNEEWYIEGNIKGARIVENMQNYAFKFDSTRAFTVAISGGWDTGIGMKVQVMGFNYLSHGDVDKHHKLFPWQPSIGTEESNTVRTRGVYVTDNAQSWLAPKNLYDDGMEGGWKYYYDRPYLSGLFYWTGFDYRGEPTPYDWPAVVSQFGILDLCGFQKDNAHYLKSWWMTNNEIHMETNWNRAEKDSFDIVVYGNCKEAELVINGRKLGRKPMPFNGHITWKVAYEEGRITAIGYGNWMNNNVKDNVPACSVFKETTGDAKYVRLFANTTSLDANGEDMSIITVSLIDSIGRTVPTACNNIEFEIEGPGNIIGLGNGNPSSHEKDQFLDSIAIENIQLAKELVVKNIDQVSKETATDYIYKSWRNIYSAESSDWQEYKDTLLIFRGTFTINELTPEAQVTIFSKDVLDGQKIYVNGTLLSANAENTFIVSHAILKQGENQICYVGKKLKWKNQWTAPNRDPGLVQIIYPVSKIQRAAFMGLAQVLVQSTKQAGTIKLTAKIEGSQKTEIIITTK